VREAEDERVNSLQHQRNMEILEDVRSGWIPQSEREWRKVRLVATRLQHPPVIYDPDEPGGILDCEPFSMDITEMCFRMACSQIRSCRQTLARAQEQAPPPLDLSGCDDDYLVLDHRQTVVDVSRFYPGGVRPPSTKPEWSTRESPEVIARLQENLRVIERKLAEMVSAHPWTAFRLKIGPDPTSDAYRTAVPKPVKPPRDLFTYTSVKKARERAADSDGRIKILPRWASYQSAMYDEVVAEIGICPPDVDANDVRVYTLDRFPKLTRGYVPGNIRWADKSQQRDNQARNGRRTMTPDLIGNARQPAAVTLSARATPETELDPSNPAAEPTDESLMP
jgi:hypothetical protein